MNVGELLSLTGLIDNIKISKNELVIGRDSSKCDVVIPRQHVSGVHCRIYVVWPSQVSANTIPLLLSPSASSSPSLSGTPTKLTTDNGFPGSPFKVTDTLSASTSSPTTATAAAVATPTYQVILLDLSSNGTYINGLLIGKNKRVVLKNGDELSLTPAPKELDSKTHEHIDHIAFVYRDIYESERQKKLLISETNESEVLNEVEFVSKLGSGAFGIVYLGINKKTNEAVAVKTIDKVSFMKKAGIKMISDAMREAVNKGVFEEVRIMSNLRHPHIVGVHNVFDTPNHVIILLDYCKGGDLESLIMKRKMFTELDSRALYYQILQGISFLHQENVVHRDLKPGNILIKEKVDGSRLPLLKITDFGLSKILDKRNGRCHTLAGTPLFIAPEVIARNLRSPLRSANANITQDLIKESALGYTTSVDMWSAGVILFLLLSGGFPFSLKQGTLLENEIINCAQSSHTAIQKLPVSIHCKDHLSRLLTFASNRMTAAEALNHPFIVDIKHISKTADTPRQMNRDPTISLSSLSKNNSPSTMEVSDSQRNNIIASDESIHHQHQLHFSIDQENEINSEVMENYNMSMDSSSSSKRMKED